MAQAQTSADLRVEFGAWVEGTVAKRDGKGMRKVWVSPAPEGEPTRVSVIRTRDGRDTHVLTLHVSEAPEILQALFDALTAPAPAAPAKAPARVKSAPTPPAPEAIAANRAIAEAAAPRVIAPVTDANRDPRQAAVSNTAKRQSVIAQARANKPAPAPRVVAPAPAKAASLEDNWLDFITA